MINDILNLTYPEIQDFFDKFVSGTTPIPYNEFFEKAGLELKESQVPSGYFLKNPSSPYITLDVNGNIILRNDIQPNSFHRHVGLQPGDVIKSINGTVYNAQNVYDLIKAAQAWSEGDEFKAVIERGGEEITLESTVVEPMAPGMRVSEIPSASSEQIELRHTWLKG